MVVRQALVGCRDAIPRPHGDGRQRYAGCEIEPERVQVGRSYSGEVAEVVDCVGLRGGNSVLESAFDLTDVFALRLRSRRRPVGGAGGLIVLPASTTVRAG
jgi:hypothetical protein